MVDVFISYARADQAAVRRLAEAVKREGYAIWWDDELPPHRSYSDVITEQIATAKAAIVVWSESAAASEWVRAEADVARNQKKLIQTSLDGRQPPMPFNQIQFAQIGDWRGEADHPGWRKIKESLAALVGETARTAYPMPSTPPPGASPPPARGRSRLLIGAILVALLALAGVGLIAWPRREAPPRPPVAAPVESAPLPAPEALPPKPEPEAPPLPPPPQERAAAPPKRADPPPVERASANPRLRRYCMNRGRETPRCRRLRAQNGE